METQITAQVQAKDVRVGDVLTDDGGHFRYAVVRVKHMGDFVKVFYRLQGADESAPPHCWEMLARQIVRHVGYTWSVA